MVGCIGLKMAVTGPNGKREVTSRSRGRGQDFELSMSEPDNPGLPVVSTL